MKRSGHYKELRMHHEILKAQVELRDHYLRFIVREVYENIGQVLSLVRVQIAMMQPENSSGPKNIMDETGDLVGQAIRDLRGLCEKFFLPGESLTPAELVTAIEREMKMLFPGVSMIVYNKPEEFSFNTGVISFYLLKSVFDSIKKPGELVSIKMDHDETHLFFELLCSNKGLDQNDRQPFGSVKLLDADISLSERIQLMGGSLQLENAAVNRDIIKLVMPYK